MSTFHRVDQRRARAGLSNELESRLPIGQSLAVMAGLSVLSWTVLISVIMALRVML